jgi:hypothetical protein
LKPESKFWKKWKAFTPNILWTRIENMSSLGTPDLLGYNKNKTFFTVELKVTTGNSVRLSPHQISFHSSLGLEAFEPTLLEACCLQLEPCIMMAPARAGTVVVIN